MALQLFFLFCLWLNASPAQGLEQRIDELELVFSHPSLTDAETRKLIPFKAGDKIAQEALEKKIEELKSVDFIEDIRHEWVIDKNKKRRLKLTIVEARFIYSISIVGNYPFLDKEIRRILPLQPGTVFKSEKIPATMKTLDAFFAKQGYWHAKFEIKPEFHPKHDTVDIRIKIKKGPVYRIGKVVVTGNTIFSELRIRNILTHFTHFKILRLKKDLKKLKSLYARKGYIKARVKLDHFTFDDIERRADLYLNIRENKKLKVNFTGKPVIPQGRLREILAFAERRSYDRYAIRIGAERLRRYYLKQGYPQVAISYKTKKTDEEVLVTYQIEAGRQVELSKIKFSGNKSFGGKKLKKQILSRESKLLQKSRFNEKKLLHDPLELSEFYKNEGYFDVQVSPPEIITNRQGDHNQALFHIAEGEPYPIGEIKITADHKINTRRLLRKADLKSGKIWTLEAITRARDKILQIYNRHGYAYTTVDITTYPHRPQNSADLHINIQRGKKAHVRRIVIRGTVQTDKKIITRNLKIREGEVFDYQKMLDAQLNLRQLGIFSNVRIKALGYEDQETEIDLLVIVHERKTISVNMLAGFDNRNWLHGELSFTKRNLFGLAKQFNTRFIGGIKFDRAEMTFSSPRVFGASWNLANQYFYQYENAPQFNAHSYGSFVSTLKNFGPRWTIGFKEQVTRTEVIASQSNIALLGNSLFDNTFNEVETFFIFDSRDNYSDPQKGFYTLVKNEVNTDITNLNNNFNTTELNLSHHQGFFGAITINNTARFGHTYKITSQPRIPVNKLFFLGGSDTIRGFVEDGLNPAGGTVFLAYNAELHLKLRDSLKLAGFFDTGFLHNNINSVSLNDLRESAGVGLRYFTPVGPLRVDWGMILDRRAGEPKGRLHFSFGYFF